jgi:ubiquinone/menaquinone biosynthesis C-methylase UbiE
MKNQILNQDFGSELNKKELFYMDNLVQKLNPLDKTALHKDNRLPTLAELLRIEPLHGSILELAAGSCWLTAELSKLPAVLEAYALDMSKSVLEEVAPQVFEATGAVQGKITRVVGDFYAFEFPKAKFDYVIFDAGLHHIEASQFTLVMQKVANVLKPGGKLIGIREPFLTPLPFLREFRRRNHGKYEKSFGITENIYTLEEWRTMFVDGGFSPEFHAQMTNYLKNPTSREKIKRKVRNSAIGSVFNRLFPPDHIIVAGKR